MVACPECDASIEVDDLEEGQRVDCPECNAELEVVATNPVELEVVADEEEEEEEAW
jgi:alpha-aminoadipate carrier protein LysW